MSDAPAVATVEVAPGVTVTAAMTPTERYNAIAKTTPGAVVAARPPGPVFGPQGITPGTANEFARRDAQLAKAPPPSAVPVQTDAVAKFDADMRANGLQKLTEVEENKLRADSIQWLEDWANARPKYWQIDNEPRLQKWAEMIRAGTHLVRRNAAGNGVDIYERNPATPAAQARNSDGTFAPATIEAAVAKAVKASNAEGWAPAAAITGPLLSGYTLPPGREYLVEQTVGGLRLARLGNLTQTQVNDIVTKG